MAGIFRRVVDTWRYLTRRFLPASFAPEPLVDVPMLFSGLCTVTATGGLLLSRTSAAPTSYYETIMLDAPVVYLQLNDPDGTTYLDHSGNGNHFTKTGTLTQTTTGSPIASEPNTTYFDGTTGYLSRTNVSGIASLVTGDSTMEIWMKANATQSGSYSMAFNWLNDLGTYHGFVIGTDNSTGYATGRIDRTDSGYADDCVHSVDYTDDTWHHIVVVRRGTTKEMWRDGVKVVDASRSGTALQDPSTNLSLGATPTGAAYYLAGGLAQFALYDTALSSARIEAHYAARLLPG